MSKTKILGILVGILSIVNIGLLIFLFTGMPKGPGPGGFGSKEKAEQFIQEKFDFNTEQMNQFRKSKANHMQNAKELEVELENLSRSFYMASNEEGRTERDSILKSINEVSIKIYNNNVTHFDEVRSICNPDQEPEMKNFINGLLTQKGKGRKKGDFRKKK
jgi:protein CpxP